MLYCGVCREQASVVISVEPEGPVYTVNVDGKAKRENQMGKCSLLADEPSGSSTPNKRQSTPLKSISSNESGDDSLRVVLAKQPLILHQKNLLSNVEYLFFMCNSIGRPEKQLCQLKLAHFLYSILVEVNLKFYSQEQFKL